MTWDVMIMNAEGAPESMADMPEDWRPTPMGLAVGIRKAVSSAIPETEWQTDHSGSYDGNGYSIGFNFREEEPVDTLDLTITGGGDPLPVIVDLCKRNGWFAVDWSTGEKIDVDNPSRESWIAFQEYRDEATGRE